MLFDWGLLDAIDTEEFCPETSDGWHCTHEEDGVQRCCCCGLEVPCE